MTAFTVWKFDIPDGAGHAASQLEHGWGALWGLLFGALCFIPLIGAAAGAAIGGVAKATEGVGSPRIIWRRSAPRSRRGRRPSSS